MSQRVLLFTSSLVDTEHEIVTLGGYIAHQLTERVVVAGLPEDIDPQHLVTAQTTPPSDLDAISDLVARAWREKEANEANPPPLIGDGLPWTAPGFEPPLNLSNNPFLAEQETGYREAQSQYQPGVPYLIGKVAVGVIIVPGVETALAISDQERTKMVAQIQQGLDWLITQVPGEGKNLTFVYDWPWIQPVTAKPYPHPTPKTIEQAEAPWRDQALKQMGFHPGLDGVEDYVYLLKERKSSDWAIAALMTKYPLGHFAYAGGARLCMNYYNGKWGPDDIHRVFAHELCHLFGADDEYSNADYQCTCMPSGYLEVPNNNCVNCTSFQMACVMGTNSGQLCDWTRGQLGWWMLNGLLVMQEGWAENGQLQYNICSQGNQWTPGKPVSYLQTTGGPGLAMYQNTLYAVNQGSEESGKLYWATFNQFTWSGQKRIPGCQIARNPVLIEYKGLLYCVYEGRGSDGKPSGRMMWVSYDGSGWSGEQQVPGVVTTGAPGLAADSTGLLWFFYQEGGETGRLMYIRTADWQHWETPNFVPDVRIAGSPSVILYKGMLYCIHEGRDTSNTPDSRLMYFVFDGIKFIGDQPVVNVVGTTGAPGLAVAHDGRLYCVHQGPWQDGLLYGFSWDGASDWSGDKQISNVTMSRSPSLVQLKWT